jgi:transposase InsO family protein
MLHQQEDLSMPWKETCAMDQRVQFIADWLSGQYGKKALCEAYGISRPTGDKWINRYQALGPEGLEERSRAPHSHPNAVSESIQARIVETKLRYQHWGPKKVVDYLRTQEPQQQWPVDSTVGEILKRAGLVRSRRRRRRVPPDTEPFAACDAPNHTWSADFKGDFRLGNGQRCYPLTISDNASRYLLQCRALGRTTTQAVQPWFEWVFREVGLPQAIRTDNGAPFASQALGGVSRLSKWWIQLGIRPERIEPGRPDQNGRHERMHRTLKAETSLPPQYCMASQQRSFERFVEEYNTIRSHEALGRKPPQSLYQPSSRPYPARIGPVTYDEGVVVRSVRHNGEIKWQGQLLYVTDVLAKEPVGLTKVDNDLWELRYSFHLLGYLDQRSGKIVPAKGWHGKKG